MWCINKSLYYRILQLFNSDKIIFIHCFGDAFMKKAQGIVRTIREAEKFDILEDQAKNTVRKLEIVANSLIR